MGGATPLLSRRRALTLGGLLVALWAYGAGAGQLPELPSGFEVVFYVAVALPAFAAAIWLGLPLARGTTRHLVVLATGAGVTAVALTITGFDSAANVSKLACYVLVGFAFLTLFEELWWITLVAVLVPWVDIWSVAAGPTEYVVEEQPGVFERVAIALSSPGEAAIVNIGPPDVVFFALFLAAATRFGLRSGATWTGMTVCLAVTLALVWYWDDLAGLPALPAVCLGFLAPNADLLWRDLRRLRTRATETE